MTLNLISANVYNSVKGPSNRNFGLIEIWFIGLQLVILIALLEYGSLLALKRYYTPRKIESGFVKVSPKDRSRKPPFDPDVFAKTIDQFFFFGSIIYILLFNIAYWSAVFILESKG